MGLSSNLIQICVFRCFRSCELWNDSCLGDRWASQVGGHTGPRRGPLTFCHPDSLLDRWPVFPVCRWDTWRWRTDGQHSLCGGVQSSWGPAMALFLQSPSFEPCTRVERWLLAVLMLGAGDLTETQCGLCGGFAIQPGRQISKQPALIPHVSGLQTKRWSRLLGTVGRPPKA